MQNLKQRVKETVGSVLVPLMPERAERVKQESFSMTMGESNFIDACLRSSIAVTMLQNSAEKELSDYHRRFWERENGTEYHRRFRELALDAFDTHFDFLVNEFNALLKANPNITTLVEIGCGGGTVMNRLPDVIEGIDRFIGIDLSPDTIAENAELFPNPQIEWVAGDAHAWITENGQSNWLFFSFRGVLEYFTQEDLASLFADVADRMQPSIFASVEPLALDFDFSQPNSRHYGTEYTFSHNYPYLFKNNGFDIVHENIQTFDDHQISTVIATTGI